MLGYAVLGTNDTERTSDFYDQLTMLLGSKCIHSFDRGFFYGETEFELAVVTPFDGNEAATGNGNMVALKASSREMVDRAYALALKLGATDEGAPGIRGSEESGFYGAYFRDADGNKLCVYRMGPA
ncbi:VOC family protein [Parasphingorhabdus sp.]|uniref:VOC family protein n=1 Tax=Parasphingorhabdus sp. TaxID=2709688 RepID=UPI0030963061